VRRVVPWAEARPADVAALFAAEAARWRGTLAWDTAALWPVLEQARVTGALPGLVLREADGAMTGWTYAAVRDGELLCGALTAPDPDGTVQLLDGVLALPAAAAASRIVCFAYTDAPDLASALAARGFLLDPHEYLTRPLAEAPPARRPGRAWDVRDLDATADLFRASYPASDPGRPFAPYSRPAEWQRYVADLVLGHGCGRFRPSLSIAVPATGGTLDAAAIVTDLGAGTAHLAQLAVRPGLRGAGLGAAMLASISAACRAAGFTRLSLLVGASNSTARRLYARAGFASCAWFVSATRAGRAGEGRRESTAA
jgi:GNAT superfamily N-acetyltransferase